MNKEENKTRENSSTIENIIVEYLKGNLGTVVWFIFLFFGGALFVAYYSQLNYLPSIDFQAALTYILIASIIGAGLFFGLLLLIYIPGYLWSKFLMCSDHLCSLFCKIKKEEHVELRKMRMLVGLVLPSTVMLLLLVEIIEKYYLHKPPILFYIGFIVVFLFKLVYMHYYEFKEIREQSKGNENVDYRTRFSTYIFWFLLSLLSMGIAILVLSYFVNYLVYFSIAIYIPIIIISVSLVAYYQYNYPLRSLLVGTFSAILLILIANHENSIPASVLHELGFSGQNVNMILKSGVFDEELKNIPEHVENNRYIDSTEILCPMGKRYFLKKNGKYFILEKEFVQYIEYLPRDTIVQLEKEK